MPIHVDTNFRMQRDSRRDRKGVRVLNADADSAGEMAAGSVSECQHAAPPRRDPCQRHGRRRAAPFKDKIKYFSQEGHHCLLLPRLLVRAWRCCMSGLLYAADRKTSKWLNQRQGAAVTLGVSSKRNSMRPEASEIAMQGISSQPRKQQSSKTLVQQALMGARSAKAEVQPAIPTYHHPISMQPRNATSTNASLPR